ncbi:MAG: SDR family NAD(P)-dependent oxidoreductase [Nocardioidaceae bacterium]|nr:MAG: SDR family NAD(P)-dependent oxidoreductase [Nocardioidaceae bacterium]
MTQSPIAVVTGGARGLGRTFARTLAELSYDVAVLDLHEADEVANDVVSAGQRFLAVSGDASDPGRQ